MNRRPSITLKPCSISGPRGPCLKGKVVELRKQKWPVVVPDAVPAAEPETAPQTAQDEAPEPEPCPAAVADVVAQLVGRMKEPAPVAPKARKSRKAEPVAA